MTKVIKCQLISRDKDNDLDYKEVYKILWELQRETRSISNRIIQLCWEYSGFESEWKAQYGEYPTKEQIKTVTNGYASMSGAIYNCINKEFNKNQSGNVATTLQNVTKKFNNVKSDIYKGNISIPSFKSDVPIDVAKKSIKLDYVVENDKKEWIAELSLLSKSYAKELGRKSSKLRFKIIATARASGTVRTILERCFDGVYSISSSQLKYDKGKWYILLCYSFEKETKELPADNIMGVHIGEHNAITASFSNSKKVLYIDGGEVEAFAAQIERRRRNIQKSTYKNSALCGGGRVGHGYKTKMKPLEHIETKISNFRNTTNHRYSREVINWAIQNKCGVIQIEDLSGWATENLERYTLLKNWSYYDLMSKIEYKAKEAGIKVVKIPYNNLHKWCCDCNTPAIIYQASENDSNEVQYICKKCGQIIDRDVNIPKALVIPDIDKIIKAEDKNDKSEDI